MKKLLISLFVLIVAGCSPADQEAFGKFMESLSQDFTKSAEQYQAKRIERKRTESLATEEHCKKITPIIIKAITPTHSEVRNLAVNLAKTSPGPYNSGQICRIWCGLKQRWAYVNDPRGSDYIAPAYDSAKIKAGDCDDFAILMSSLVEAIGGRSRVVAAYDKQAAHMYAEVYIGSTKKEADQVVGWIAKENFMKVYGLIEYNYWIDLSGYWLNLDWSAPHPGGPFFQADIRFRVYPDGTCERGN